MEDVKKAREIKHGNTRFEGSPFAVDSHKTNMAQAVAQQASKQQGKIGADGKEVVTGQGATVNGFGFVATPSPAPGKVAFLYLQVIKGHLYINNTITTRKCIDLVLWLCCLLLLLQYPA